MNGAEAWLGAHRKHFRSTIAVTDGKALVKIVDPVELMGAREEKRAQAAAKTAKKAAAVEAEKQKKLEKILKGKISPGEMFMPPNVPEDAYGSWNEDGLPLTNGEGKELSKNQVKKVAKERALQKRLHEEYLEWERRARDDLVVQ